MNDKLHFTIGDKAWSLTPFRCPADFDALPAAEIVRGQLAAMPADAHAAFHWRKYIGNVKAVEAGDALCAAAAGPLFVWSVWAGDGRNIRWAGDDWGQPSRVEAECDAFNAAMFACAAFNHMRAA